MEDNIRRWELWTAVIIALAPYVYQFYARWRDSRDKVPEQKMTETDKIYQAWEDIAEGYAKQIERLSAYETENRELRPLVLKVALQAQQIKMCRDDKEDWKDYAQKLAEQLESLGHIPHAFRRTPRDGDTDEKMKPISQKILAVQSEVRKKNGDSEEKDSTITNGKQVGE